MAYFQSQLEGPCALCGVLGSRAQSLDVGYLTRRVR